MTKKYQIFVSSTFSDLKKERQASVEAILTAGHIPAGMELFSAGSESQLETIKRWINDSDIYMLLLGGRYGSIEPKSGLSYTEVEYKYATDMAKPYFALIMSDDLLKEKVKLEGQEMIELDNRDKFKAFKELVLSRMAKFFNNTGDLQFSILQAILHLQDIHSLTGWVKENEVINTAKILNQISNLNEENKNLKEKLKELDNPYNDKIGEFTYNELKQALGKISISLPSKDRSIMVQTNVFHFMDEYEEELIYGFQIFRDENNTHFDFYEKALSHLKRFGLIQEERISPMSLKYQFSVLGSKFHLKHSERRSNNDLEVDRSLPLT